MVVDSPEEQVESGFPGSTFLAPTILPPAAEYSPAHQLTISPTHLTSPPAQQPRARGWQKLRDRAASGCIKLWTWTKILSPTVYILYFVENLRFPDTEEKQLAFVHMKSKDGLILSRKQHTAPHQILFSTYSHDSLALQLTLMISIPMIT